MKIETIIGATLGVLVLGFFLFMGAFTPPTVGVETYRSDAIGISFVHPDAYLVSEASEPETNHRVIVLIRKDDITPGAGESPRAIVFDIYGNPDNQQTLRGWIENMPQSNLRLGNGVVNDTVVDSVDAVMYRWSGLYNGETTAFLHGQQIVLVSVMYDAPTDGIYTDYQNLLATIMLIEPEGSQNN